MKTFLEKQYERAVISNICRLSITSEERAALMVDFHENSETYYDNLCDALLAVSTGQNTVPIWISQNGDCYASLRTKDPHDRVLIFPDLVPDFCVDLVDQLEVAILKIQY